MLSIGCCILIEAIQMGLAGVFYVRGTISLQLHLVNGGNYVTEGPVIDRSLYAVHWNVQLLSTKNEIM